MASRNTSANSGRGVAVGMGAAVGVAVGAAVVAVGMGVAVGAGVAELQPRGMVNITMRRSDLRYLLMYRELIIGFMAGYFNQ